MLTYLRNHITPDTRAKLYVAGALIAVTVGGAAQLDESTQQAVVAVVMSSITFLLAMINATSGRVAAAYALVGSVAALGQIWATVDAQGWVGWLGVALSIAGQIVAALRTPTPLTIDGGLVQSAVESIDLPPAVRAGIEYGYGQRGLDEPYTGEHRKPDGEQ